MTPAVEAVHPSGWYMHRRLFATRQAEKTSSRTVNAVYSSSTMPTRALEGSRYLLTYIVPRHVFHERAHNASTKSFLPARASEASRYYLPVTNTGDTCDSQHPNPVLCGKPYRYST